MNCCVALRDLLRDAFQLEKPSTAFSFPGPDSRLYHGPLGIRKKFVDVKTLANKYVPPDCMWFYNELIQEADATCHVDN